MFAMKISDLMLDMATGDASPQDAFIQEAMGKINVSSAIFDAACLISELPSEDIPSTILEAANAQKLPVTKEGSVGVANEAVCRELDAFFDLMIATAKKTKEAANKSLAVLRTVAKSLGVKRSDDYLNGFVKPLQTAFNNAYPKGMSLKDGDGFIKAKYAARMAENYCKGAINILAGYGISIDDVLNDNVVSLVVRSNTKARKDVADLRDVEANLSTGGKLLAFDKTVRKDMHYTDTVKSNDINTFAIAVYIIIAVSDAIIKQGSKKKAACGNMRKIVGNCAAATKRVARSCESISDGVKDWSQNLNSLSTCITKTFVDSIYGLSSVIVEKSK